MQVRWTREAKMPADIQTCPKCGALITPNLARCRQCGTYLHGTRLEGVLFEHLLPRQLAASPGTGLLLLLIFLYYALMTVLAGLESAISFSAFSLGQLGSTFRPGILAGEHWRFVTSVFMHGDLLHLAFNVYALTIVGPLMEQAFDKKKTILIFMVTGIASMMISYGTYLVLGSGPVWGSVGASGAISGLIGATLVAAKRLGPAGREVASAMIRWAVIIGIFGLAVGGIDNAAHAGGFVVGAGLASVVPLGLTKTVAGQKLLSVAVLGFLALLIASAGLMIQRARGFPMALSDDAQPRNLLFFTVSRGTPFDHSTQRELTLDCVGGEDASEAQLRTCELATRAYPIPPNFAALARLQRARGDLDAARRTERVLDAMQRR